MSRNTAAPAPTRPLPPAEATFTIDEVVRQVGTSVRTVRHYIAQRVLVAPPFRSSNTRYDRAFLVRFEAARALRERGVHLPDIRAQLEAMPFIEMARLAGYEVEASSQVGAGGGTGTLGRGTATATVRPGAGAGAAGAAKGTAVLPAGFVGPYRAGPGTASERWEHFEVCPGVRLLVRTEADAEAWRVAREMLSLFAAKSG